MMSNELNSLFSIGGMYGKVTLIENIYPPRGRVLQLFHCFFGYAEIKNMRSFISASCSSTGVCASRTIFYIYNCHKYSEVSLVRGEHSRIPIRTSFSIYCLPWFKHIHISSRAVENREAFFLQFKQFLFLRRKILGRFKFIFHLLT